MKTFYFDSINFLSKLTFRKVFNAILIYKSYFISKILKKAVHWGMPMSAAIEATTNCNLKCPECPSGLRKFSRPTGTIDLENFKRYIDKIEKDLIYLMMYFQGEPYMNKQFFELVRYASSKNIYTATSTNGHFLDEENSCNTIESGLDRIIISLDGTEQESYSSYRIGGDFDKVISGIRNLVEWKKKLKVKKPYLVLQFLVLKTNEHLFDEIKMLSKELGVDEVQFKKAQFYDLQNGNTLIPMNDKYSRYKKNADGTYSLKKKVKNNCLRMWQSLVISWDGRVVPCCFDKDAAHQMGDLNKSSIIEIWKGKTYKAFRKEVITRRKNIGICCNCTE